MELVYLWVEDYKNIKKQGFNFSPRFECDFDGENLTIDENEDYASIFPENINITAIVGENGSGKSSLLNFIIEQSEYCGIFVFKGKEELLIFNKNIMNKNCNIKSNFKYKLNPNCIDILTDRYRTSVLFLKSYMDINTYTMNQQLIKRNFFQFSEKIDFISDLHKNTVELFNIVSINSQKNIEDSFQTDPYSLLSLNQHFTYLKNKYLHKVLKYYPDLEKFISLYFKVDKVEFNLKDLGAIFLASPKFKDYYKEDKFLNNMFNIFSKAKSTDNKLKIVCLIFCYIDEEEIKSFILEQEGNLSYLELYELLKGQKYSYIIIWNNFIELMNSKDDFKIIVKEYITFIKEIRREILEFNFTPSLSSGEEKLLYLFVNIYDYILTMKLSGVMKFTIIIDEPDTLLHPNWQKKLIYLLMTFLNRFFKNDIFNIIITSHSPFILSDLPKENVIFLDKYRFNDNEVIEEKQKIGNCKNFSNFVDIEQTFGANIHTLLSDGFFMSDGLMGEFAKGKIEEIIEFHNEVEKYKENDTELLKLKQEYETVENCITKKEYFENIQSIIGDDYLKQVIKNHLVEIVKILYKDKYIDTEIERVKLELKKLEEIKNASS